MIDKIIKALAECGVTEYRINEDRVETAELFFVRKNLDMRRINESCSRVVTIFRRVEGEKGSTSVIVHPGMTDDELKKAIADAYENVKYALNPDFEPVRGGRSDHIPFSGELAENTLQQSAGIMAKALFAADKSEDAFINSAEIFVTRKDARIITSEGIDVSYTSCRTDGEFVVQCVSPEDVEMYHSFSYDNLAADELTRKAAEAIATVRDRSKAKNSPVGGSYTVLLSGNYVRELLSFYADRAEAGYIYPGYSDYAIGAKVQGEAPEGELVSITGCAVEPYSMEGVPMSDRPIIENGEVRLIQGNTRFCRYLGVEPTGSYSKISCSNGTVPFEDMKKAGRCLYVASMSDFQTDVFSGRFGGEIRLAYLYDGDSVTLLTGGSINGSLLECHGNLVFSTERYSSASYEGPFAVMLKGVNVAGTEE